MHSLHEMYAERCDVIPQQVNVYYAGAGRGASPSGAISRKTNAQPNGLKQRIYTSTPKYKHKFNKQINSRQHQQQQQQQQQRQRQRSDAIGARTKHYICVGVAALYAAVKGQGSALDLRLKALLLSFGIVIIGYQAVLLIMPYTDVQQLSGYVQAQLSAAMDWTEEHQLRSKLSPLLCGILMAVFSYGMVYMDSAEPGVNPPATLRRSRRGSSGLSLSYLGALCSGALVTILMYMDL
ncbi:hypothetical protein KR222_000172 [Zaprionus bogoriensis]|nr:hypothetical protein KR222_000172 [Zaprionus bogoriensis]